MGASLRSVAWKQHGRTVTRTPPRRVSRVPTSPLKPGSSHSVSVRVSGRRRRRKDGKKGGTLGVDPVDYKST